MNQELQKQLASLIEKATAAGQDAWGFAYKQAPEVIQQYLQWEFLEHAITAGALLALSIVFGVIILRTKPEFNKDWRDKDETKIIACIICSILLIFTTVFSGINAMTALKIKMAPKVYLIETIVGRK